MSQYIGRHCPISIFYPRSQLFVHVGDKKIYTPTLYHYAYCLAYPSHAELLASSKISDIQLLRFCDEYFETSEAAVKEGLYNAMMELLTRDRSFVNYLRKTTRNICEQTSLDGYFCGRDNLYGQLLTQLRDEHLRPVDIQHTPQDIKDLVGTIYNRSINTYVQKVK